MRVTAAVFSALLASAAAELHVFFGEDLNLSGDGDNSHPDFKPLASAPNSDAARDEMFNFLIDPFGATVNLDDQPDGTGDDSDVPLILDFGDFTASILGGHIVSGRTRGQYPISGHKYFRSRLSEWTMNFSCPVAGFGFYAVDLGDVRAPGGKLFVEFEFDMPDGDGEESIRVKHSRNQSGNVVYFGYIDEDNPVTSITFINTAGNRDVFAFDNFTAVKPTNVDRCIPGFGIRNDENNVCCCESCYDGRPGLTDEQKVCGSCNCGVLNGGASDCCPEAILGDMMPCTSATQCGCTLGPDRSGFTIPSGSGFGERGDCVAPWEI